MNLNQFAYPKEEKLKSRKKIKRVFEEGKTVKKYPILVRYIELEVESHQVGVSVSKRNFKKAVDRIRIKRQLREAYRLNKSELADKPAKYAIMLIFIGREHTASDVIHKTVKGILKAIT